MTESTDELTPEMEDTLRSTLAVIRAEVLPAKSLEELLGTNDSEAIAPIEGIDTARTDKRSNWWLGGLAAAAAALFLVSLVTRPWETNGANDEDTQVVTSDPELLNPPTTTTPLPPAEGLQVLSPAGSPHLIVDHPGLSDFQTEVVLRDPSNVELLQSDGRVVISTLTSEPTMPRTQAEVLGRSQFDREGPSLPGTTIDQIDHHLVSAATWEAIRSDPDLDTDGLEDVEFDVAGLRIKRSLRGSLSTNLKPVIDAGGQRVAFGGAAREGVSPIWVDHNGEKFWVSVSSLSLVDIEAARPHGIVLDEVAQRSYAVINLGEDPEDLAFTLHFTERSITGEVKATDFPDSAGPEEANQIGDHEATVASEPVPPRPVNLQVMRERYDSIDVAFDASQIVVVGRTTASHVDRVYDRAPPIAEIHQEFEIEQVLRTSDGVSVGDFVEVVSEIIDPNSAYGADLSLVTADTTFFRTLHKSDRYLLLLSRGKDSSGDVVYFKTTGDSIRLDGDRLVGVEDRLSDMYGLDAGVPNVEEPFPHLDGSDEGTVDDLMNRSQAAN